MVQIMGAARLPLCREQLAWCRRLMVLALLWLSAPLAWAQGNLFSNCTAGSTDPWQYAATFDRPTPANIYVPQSVGAVVLNGTIYTDFICDVTSTSVNTVLIIGSNVGSATYLMGSNGTLTLRATGQTITVTTVSGSCAQQTGSPAYDNRSSQTYVSVNFRPLMTGRCRIRYEYNFTIAVAALPTVDTDFPLNFGVSSQNKTSPSCTFRSTSLCQWLIAGGTAISSRDLTSPTNPLTVTRFVSVPCTLSSAYTTVSLDPTNVTSLALPGSAAQPRSFSITLTGCRALSSAYIANSTWTYTADGTLSTMIFNSAASPAGNVGVQILDADTAAPVANNGVVTLANVTAAGNYTKNFIARYISKGSATPGAVTGIAQFTLSYQ